MKSLRTYGVFLLVLIACLVTTIAFTKRMFPWQRVPEIAEITTDVAKIKELPPVKLRSSDWPWWRGPHSDNVSGAKSTNSAKGPVTTWDEKSNILWKSPVPGRGHASPVVVGDRVFIATSDEGEQTQSMLCFDRKTGDQLWSKTIHTGSLPRKHGDNTHASATPACDGDRVYVPFVNGSALWVTALNVDDGKIAWQTEAGPFVSEHGYGSSPVIFESLVIVNGDSVGGGFIAGLHRESGKVEWRTFRPNGGGHGSYGSPVIGKICGKPQLVQGGTGKLCSYDPATGQLIWYCEGPSQVTGNTPAFNEEYVIASGGFPEKFVLCIKADGKDDVTDSKVVWRSERNVPYVPSPLVVKDLLYLAGGNGMLSCVEVASGDRVWKDRVRGRFSSSPVVADGNIYLASEDGDTYVFKTGREFELIATNHLDEGTLSTPAISGGRIFLRTTSFLYCIGDDKQVDSKKPQSKSTD